MIKCFAFGLLAFVLSSFAIAEADSVSFSFETSQLPLSKELRLSFPKIKSARFVIVNKKAKVILFEKNSNEQINLSDSSSKTLHDICCSFSFIENIKQPRKFRSQLSGLGCVFSYTNSNNCEFTYALYGANSDEDMMNDIKAINSWLDQFFLYKVAEKNEAIANIPVFYAQNNSVKLTIHEDQFLLISKNCNKNITKTSKYRTMLRAPLSEGAVVGSVSYKNSTFENSIKKPLMLCSSLQKSSRFKAICDSIHYIIFASPFASKKSKKEDNAE